MNVSELQFQVLRYYELNPDKAERYKNELQALRKAIYFPEICFPNDLSLEIMKLNLPVQEVNGKKKEVLVSQDFKIYFPSEYSCDDAINASLLLLAEQSVKSPHRYTRVPQNTSVIDVGCSEGFFSRVYCDRTNEVFGFDELMWMDAYLTTMREFDASFIPQLVDEKSKIEIEFHKPLGCIKIDVEGTELKVLEAFKSQIERWHPVLQIAVYHYYDEYDEVTRYLGQFGYNSFKQVVEDAVMLFHDDVQVPPYFRKGVIIATRE